MGDTNPCFKAEHGAWKLANAGTPKVRGFDEALRSAQAATTCGLPGRARAHVLGLPLKLQDGSCWQFIPIHGRLHKIKAAKIAWYETQTEETCWSS